MSFIESALSGAWMRAVGFATQAAEITEALSGVLGEAVPAAGAVAGLVLEGEAGSARAAWRCEAAEAAALLGEGGPVRQVLASHDEWPDTGLVLSRGTAEGWADGFEHLLLVPLRVRGLTAGTLVLVFGPGPPPAAESQELSAGFGGLLALALENDRLYEEARGALQVRDHFLTALNHELRTPAHALLLSADLLRAEAPTLPPHLDRALHDAEESVYQLVGALRRVLDLGSLGDPMDSKRADIVQPRELVAELLRRVEPRAKRKHLSIALYVPRNLPPLQTDQERFSRILLHLFSNAIKYTSRGGVEVRVERATRRISRQRQEPVLIIRVRDTGRGIPPEEMQRIFEPFAQVDEGARSDSAQRGLGLGLPLARQLARSLGGDVSIESQPERGTVATLVLPYQQAGG